MFFGHNGEAETLRCLADSGLRVRDSSVEKQDNEEAAFMWIEAVCESVIWLIERGIVQVEGNTV